MLSFDAINGDAGAKTTSSSSSQASDQTQVNGAVDSKPQKGAAPAKGNKPKRDMRPVDLNLLNLKVGVIRKAERHPDADSLYVEEVDCGEEQPRTVGSSAHCVCLK